MRLIDGDRLISCIDDLFEKTDPAGEEQLGVMKARLLVKNAPTVDAVPARHGEWRYWTFRENDPCEKVTVDGVMMCKECGKGWKRVKGEWFNHCPYCGVRLDGGRRKE